MSRVAVVTGGTRGIGAAVSKALAKAGYKVAATYHGNDEAAAKFHAETGVSVYKWDVANYDACVAGLAKVAAELGPVEVLVNNAGVTRDGMFHKMTPEQWRTVIETNLVLAVQYVPAGDRRHARARLRPDRQHFLDQRPEGPDGPGQLFRRQGRRHRLHQGAGAGERQPRA